MKRPWAPILLAVAACVTFLPGAQAQEPCDDPLTCLGAVDLERVVTYRPVFFSGMASDIGKYRSVGCDPAVEVVADQYVTIGIGSTRTEYYSGSFCVPSGAVPGDVPISSELLMEAIDLPAVEVHHNPHATFLLVNLPTWFWHEGPTTHVQSATYDLDARTRISGTYRGRVASYCWTVDDPRPALPPRQLGGSACTGADGTDSYVAAQPGGDSAEAAAATHTFDRHGYTTTITHEVVWAGTFTVTQGPPPLVGEQLSLRPTVVRARTQRPVRQLVPAPVPNG